MASWRRRRDGPPLRLPRVRAAMRVDLILTIGIRVALAVHDIGRHRQPCRFGFATRTHRLIIRLCPELARPIRIATIIDLAGQGVLVFRVMFIPKLVPVARGLRTQSALNRLSNAHANASR
jgi:hypothetical protein